MNTDRLIRPATAGAPLPFVGARVLRGGGPADGYRRSVRAADPARRPNYALRRLVAAMTLAAGLVASVVVVGNVMASLAGTPAVAAEVSIGDATGGTVERHHVAAPGDTLWSIAERYHGEVDHGRYLDALIRLNGGTRIEVGEAVRLP